MFSYWHALIKSSHECKGILNPALLVLTRTMYANMAELNSRSFINSYLLLDLKHLYTVLRDSFCVGLN